MSKTLALMKEDIFKNSTSITQLIDTLADQTKKTTTLERDFNTIKEVIVKQQEYLEKCKSKELAKSLIVPGVPCEGLLIGDTDHQGDVDISLAILRYIGMQEITEDDFEIYVPPKVENRGTYIIKLNFKEDTLVKEIKHLPSAAIYINMDKPYHTRK